VLLPHPASDARGENGGHRRPPLASLADPPQEWNSTKRDRVGRVCIPNARMISSCARPSGWCCAGRWSVTAGYPDRNDRSSAKGTSETPKTLGGRHDECSAARQGRPRHGRQRGDRARPGCWHPGAYAEGSPLHWSQPMKLPSISSSSQGSQSRTTVPETLRGMVGSPGSLSRRLKIRPMLVSPVFH
jgi:hypothetical protein